MYDFTTTVNRLDQNAEKWVTMHDKNPEVGKNVAPFSIADLDMKNAPEITEGLKAYLDEAVLGYTKPGQAYLDSVVNWMKRRHNWTITADQIAVSGGIIPAIHDFVRCYAKEGEGVILLTPVYYPFYSAIRNNNRKTVEVPLLTDGSKYTINFDALEAVAKDPNNKLILFSSPHNPVGRVWTKEELYKVGKICTDNHVVIVSDEIHFDLIMPGYVHTVFATVSDEFSHNVVTCTSPSKSFNVAGMLTSAIIFNDDGLKAAFLKQQEKNGFDCLSPLGYKTCEIAYNKCEKWLDGLIALVSRNYGVLKAYVAEKLPQVKLYPLEGTYLAWMDFSALGLSAEELEAFNIHEAQVFFDEGYVFGKVGSCFERMNIACPTATMVAALDRITEKLKEKKIL
jgi:cystathionine beta-lyase